MKMINEIKNSNLIKLVLLNQIVENDNSLMIINLKLCKYFYYKQYLTITI